MYSESHYYQLQVGMTIYFFYISNSTSADGTRTSNFEFLKIWQSGKRPPNYRNFSQLLGSKFIRKNVREILPLFYHLLCKHFTHSNPDYRQAAKELATYFINSFKNLA